MRPMLPYIPDRAAAIEAAEWVARLGPDRAATEAAAHAGASRDRGNVAHFCRWRQVERLVAILALPAAPGPVH